MPRFDASTAECLIFTFKEGVLSAVAHDLKLRVGRFELELGDERAIEARFDARSIEVVCARMRDRDAPGLLSEADMRSIQQNLAGDVLDSGRYPEIRFSGRIAVQGDAPAISGNLALHGREQPIAIETRRDADRIIAGARIHQPDFGIRPYRAMLGALRVKADVVVHLSVPTAAL